MATQPLQPQYGVDIAKVGVATARAKLIDHSW